MKMISHGLTLVCLVLLISCKPKDFESGSSVRMTDAPHDIFLSLAHPFQKAFYKYELVYSVPFQADLSGVCSIRSLNDDCSPQGKTEFYQGTLIYATQTRKFFKTPDQAKFKDRMKLAIVAFNEQTGYSSRRNLQIRQADKLSASTQQPGQVAPSGATMPGQSNSPALTGLRENLRRNCDIPDCHARYVDNPARLRTDGSEMQILSGAMPKGRILTAEDRQQILEFIKN